MKNATQILLSTLKTLTVTTILGCTLSTLALASDNEEAQLNQLVLNYDGFYDRIDDLDDAEYQDIKLAFYFVNASKQACPVTSVKLKTQLKELEVYYLESGEILLPFDYQLDKDKAAIVIDKADNQQCGLDMRLETSILFDESVTVSKAKSLVNTFDVALNDLAGMMSFTLPDVVGVTFIADENSVLTIKNGNAGECKMNRCTLTLANLNEFQEDVIFSQKIIKAVPFIQ